MVHKLQYITVTFILIILRRTFTVTLRNGEVRIGNILTIITQCITKRFFFIYCYYATTISTCFLMKFDDKFDKSDQYVEYMCSLFNFELFCVHYKKLSCCYVRNCLQGMTSNKLLVCRYLPWKSRDEVYMKITFNNCEYCDKFKCMLCVFVRAHRPRSRSCFVPGAPDNAQSYFIITFALLS